MPLACCSFLAGASSCLPLRHCPLRRQLKAAIGGWRTDAGSRLDKRAAARAAARWANGALRLACYLYSGRLLYILAAAAAALRCNAAPPPSILPRRLPLFLLPLGSSLAAPATLAAGNAYAAAAHCLWRDGWRRKYRASVRAYTTLQHLPADIR